MIYLARHSAPSSIAGSWNVYTDGPPLVGYGSLVIPITAADILRLHHAAEKGVVADFSVMPYIEIPRGEQQPPPAA